VAVERDSPLIRGVEVLAGNAGDQEKALDLVPQSERVMEAEDLLTLQDGSQPVKRRRAMLASNPLRNSRWETVAGAARASPLLLIKG
jgi:hypothetical protein